MRKNDLDNHHVLDDLIEEYLTSNKDTKGTLLDEFADAGRKNLPWDDMLGEKNKVGKEIKEGIDLKIAFLSRPKKIRKLLYYASSAAAVLLIICFSVIVNYNKQSNSYLSVQTASKSDSVLLADGTLVYLSPHTLFSYPVKFDKEIRNVSLDKGNAFFKVARNPQKPFIVTSGNIKTKVLGTSFNIHMYKDNYYVVVHTGKVNVSSNDSGVNLLPYQEARFSKVNNRFSIRSVSHEEVNPWYNSDITLTNQTLETILKVVVQKYGVERYSVDPELLNVKATVFISKHDSLNAVINQINYITNLKLNANEEIITNRNSVDNL